LLYHFGDKLSLVATILRISNDRSVQGIRELDPSRNVRAAVIDLWDAVSSPAQAQCQRLYVEAAALGVLGTEPFASVVAEANGVWLGPGGPPRRLRRPQASCTASSPAGGGRFHGTAARRAARGPGRGQAECP
jgi:hypothetical protein